MAGNYRRLPGETLALVDPAREMRIYDALPAHVRRHRGLRDEGTAVCGGRCAAAGPAGRGGYRDDALGRRGVAAGL